MARLIYGMMQSLDGYIDGPAGNIQLGPPDPIVFRHFTDHVSRLEGMLYGRRMYDLMRYWEEDQPSLDEDELRFAKAWRSKPKWVASHAAAPVGLNASLVQGDLVAFAAQLRSHRDGEIDVAGAELARVLSAAALIDEYRLYLRPQVLGAGKPYFSGSEPPLRLQNLERIGEDVVRLTYVPS